MKFVCALAILTAVTTSAWADDSSASLAAGGLTFVKQPDIRMAAEDLYVSPDKVSIRFEFANNSTKDIDAIVAFPLPDIDLGDDRANATYYGPMSPDPQNFVGFTTRADGKPVTASVDQRAFYQGRDVTALVAAERIAVNMVPEKNVAQLQLVPGDARKRLLDAGIVALRGKYLRPKWTVRTRFYWMQHFPRAKTVVLEHFYRPVTGSSNTAPNEFDDTEWLGDMRKRYCLDSRTEKAWRASLEARAVSVEWTDYVLTTARNWKGPIGRFHLVIDKLKPQNLMTLCWNGALRTASSTTFVFDARDFVPEQDIHLMVLE